jgi:hypothetical protein
VRRSLKCSVLLASVVAVALTAAVSARAEALDKATEAAALGFARTHHAELASLLEQLKKSAPSEYQAAITDLERSRERLERTRERMPGRYDLELAEWKLSSRIRLLAARMSMGDDSPLDDELRSALRERAEIRLQLLEEERERTAKRLERLDEQIADQRSKADDVVNRELAAIRRSMATNAAKAARAAKSQGVPAAKPAVKPDVRTKSGAPVKSDAKAPAGRKPAPNAPGPKAPAKQPDIVKPETVKSDKKS